MRPLAGLIAAGLLFPGGGGASAGPQAADGYAMEVVRQPAAIFAGLACDGDAILVTNLADGRLYRYGTDGEFAAFGPTLPHGTDVMGDPTGPYKVLPAESGWVVVQGWPPTDGKESPYDHALLRIDGAGGVKVLSNDFWNPFSLVASGDAYFVVDAARNSIERIGEDGGNRMTLFGFARLSEREGALKQLSPTEFSGGKTYEFDAVPTGIALRQGRLVVSLFTGFPFVAGAGRVVSLPAAAGPVSEARVEVADLNAPVDVTGSEDGGMLVLEHGIYDPSGGTWIAGSGRLLHIDSPTGEQKVILDGLTRPAAVLRCDQNRIVVSQLDGTLIFLRPVAR